MSNLENNQTENWSLNLKLNRKQFEFLANSPAQGLSKIAALISILDAVTTTEKIFTPAKGEPFVLYPGQAVVTITDLAIRWRWARVTVRKFLDSLEELGVIKRISYDRCSVILVNLEWPLPLNKDDSVSDNLSTFNPLNPSKYDCSIDYAEAAVETLE